MIYAFTVVFVIAFLITSYMVPRILLASLRKRLIDKPNKRKVHTVTSSRLGGVAFYPAIIVSIIAVIAAWSVVDRGVIYSTLPMQFVIALVAVFVMYIVGLFDDVVGIRYRKKFVFQIFASLLVVASGLWISDLHGFLGIHKMPWWIGMPLTMLFMVFVMNAVNLIDGIDGLCSGLSIVALGVMGAYFIMLDDVVQSMVCIATAGALLAFFRYNVRGFAHRSLKIFMGDSGSLTIGTILGICAIRLIQHSDEEWGATTPLLVAYSVLIIPCFDVLRVMLHRLRIKKNMFLPDRSHIHHKFLALGFNPRQSLAVILSMAALFISVNALLQSIGLRLEFTVLIDVTVYTLLNLYLTSRIPADAEFKIAMTEQHYAALSKRRRRFFFF